MLRKIVSVVLNRLIWLNDSVEGNYEDAAPCALIGGSDTGKVVSEQAERMRRLNNLRLLILFLHLERVCTGDLLDRGRREAAAFLQLAGDHQPFPAQSGQRGLVI